MSEDRQIKQVKLSVPTWKAIMQMKLDLNKPSVDEVVKELVRDAGY